MPAHSPVALLRRVLPARDAVGALALALAVAVLEGAGVVLLVPLLALVGIDAGGGAAAGIAETAGRMLATLRIPLTLASVLTMYVGVVAAQAAVAHAEAIVAVRMREAVAARMRELLYRAVARMRWRAFIERHSSQYVHTLTTQLEQAQLAVSQSMAFVAQTLVAAVYVAVALRLAPLLSTLALVGGALLILLTRRYARTLQASGAELNVATQRLHTTVVEHLSNMKVAKTFAAERQHIGHFEAASRAVATTWAATGAAYAGSRTVFSIGAAVMLAAVVYAGATGFGLGPAAILLLLYVFGRLVPRIGALQQLLHQIVHSYPAFAATAVALEVYEGETEPEERAEDAPLSLSRGVRFEDVSFNYSTGQPVLEEVSFEIPAGQVTVLVGPSGAGKTTVVDLLLGLLEPAAGAIRVDGERLTRQVAAGWRRSVAYVPQETVLFNDTIRSNLLWAVPEAGDEDIRRALAAARAEFVHSLPAGLDSIVGERGAWLSGGERQRIALARALLRQPRLLVLDEPTSSLDAENEGAVLDAIQSLRGAVTIVVISHREAALAIADQVLVLQRGRLVHVDETAARPAQPAARG